MDVLEAIRTRRSVRSYSRRLIPDDVMARVLEALRDAPSACNNQPWQFVVVSGESMRRQLARAAREQDWMAEAPVTVVACGFPEQAYQHMGGTGNSVEIDVAIVVAFFMALHVDMVSLVKLFSTLFTVPMKIFFLFCLLVLKGMMIIDVSVPASLGEVDL